MELRVNLKENSYSIILGNNLIKNIDKYYSLNSKVLVITDNNIPSLYSDLITNKCKKGYQYIIKEGEESKNINNYLEINKFLLDNNFSRQDLIIAVGGGVVGDLSAFIASTYKRGINFINVPTSTLAMIDSSVGGKTAINFEGVKNVLGSFYQPKLVVIDFDVLKTLNERHFNNGLVEALKMGFIKDKSIIDLFSDYKKNIKDIIIKSLKAKIEIVEMDEKENNIRKILNFGHTLGHAFEMSSNLLHGEAVGLGMYYVLDKDLKDKMKDILNLLKINVNYEINKDKVLNLVMNDKKVINNTLDLITVEELGKAKITNVEISKIETILKEGA